jgi:MinD superfamily P-loop ATPase
VCAYNALAVLPDQVLVFSELCHGCGGCSLLCPEKAIREKGRRIGLIHKGKLPQLEFLQGRLDAGQPLSPPVIRELKKLISPERAVLIDSPPGTSCPAVESIKGSDFVLLVTEPTPFGLNDLKLAVETLKKLQLPAGIIINRSQSPHDRMIEEYCHQENLPILMKIPFDRGIAQAYSEGKPLLQYQPSYQKKFLELWARIRKLIQ